MQRFMGMHSFPCGAFTQDQVAQLANAAQHDPVVRGYRSFVNLSQGKAVCIMDAPDERAVSDWFKKMGMPCDGVVPVELEGERGEIRSA